MRLVEEIILKVGVDTRGLNQKLAKAGQGFTRLEEKTDDNTRSQGKLSKQLKRTNTGMKDLDQSNKKSAKSSEGASRGFTKMAAGASAVALSAVGAALAIRELVQEANAMTEATRDAERLGVMANDLNILQGVGLKFGATAEDVTQGIKNINESASEAFKEQSGEKFELFEELNIDLEKFNRLKPDKQLEEFSRSLNGVENQGRQTAIKLALMGEEGFKLSLTMKELGKDADGVKRSVSDSLDSINSPELAEANAHWQDLVLAFKGIKQTGVNTALSLTSNILKAAAPASKDFLKNIRQLIGALDGRNIAQENYNRLLKEQAAKGKEILELTKKQRQEEKELRESRDERQAQHTKFLASLREQLKAQEGTGEGEKEAERKFKARQKEFEEIRKKEKEEDDRKAKEAQERINEIKRKGEAGQKILGDERRARRRALIDRLRESGQASLNFATEAGSVQAQILRQEISGRDAGKLSRADELERQADKEDKDIRKKELELAKEAVDKLDSINKTLKNNKSNVRGIRN